jgi:hypothetical protein
MGISTNSLAPTSSSTSLYTSYIPPKIASLFTKINLIYSLCIAASVYFAYQCFYNLQRTYQLKHHNTDLLDQNLKFLKYKALLEEAKSGENAQAQLDNWEAVVTSITDESFSLRKDCLLAELAQHYVKDAPARSYSIAKKLSIPSRKVEIIASIQQLHKDFDWTDLHLLFDQNFEETLLQTDTSSTSKDTLEENIDQLLKFVSAFSKMREALLDQFTRKALTTENSPSKQKPSLKRLGKCRKKCIERALDYAKQLPDILSRVQAFCKIAERCESFEDRKGKNSALTSAQELLNENRADVNLIQARLFLANTYSSFGKNQEMDQELNKVREVFEGEIPLPAIKELHSLAQLLTAPEMESIIEKTMAVLDKDSLDATTVKDRAMGFLSIASIYGEGLLSDADAKTKIINSAFEAIKKLPEGNHGDVKFKGNQLIRLIGCCDDNKQALEIWKELESLYDRCPKDEPVFNAKSMLGYAILSSQDELEVVKEKLVEFAKKVLSHARDATRDRYDRFDDIISISKLPSQTLEGRKALLQEAESLLREETDPNNYGYTRGLKTFLEEYLDVYEGRECREKAVALLNDYQDRQARSSLVTAIFMGGALFLMCFSSWQSLYGRVTSL